MRNLYCTSPRQPGARARWLVVVVLIIATLVASCGHPGRPSAQRSGLHGHAPFWTFQYVHFATLSDGWAMADNDQSGFTDLFTSHDGGRRWHDVTPPVVLAGEKAEIDNPDATSPLQTPFVLNSRDAWLTVGAPSYGRSSMLEVFMTSDAGRRWALRGRFRGQGCWTLFS